MAPSLCVPNVARMEERLPQIVAFGGGGFSMDAGNPLLDDYVLRATGVKRPRVCFVPTASGDADHYVVRFYRTFTAMGCEPSHLSLFRRDRTAATGDPGEHLLAQDLIYVGGGSVISLLGAWRAHGIDLALTEAWRRGAPGRAARARLRRGPGRGDRPHRGRTRRPRAPGRGTPRAAERAAGRVVAGGRGGPC